MAEDYEGGDTSLDNGFRFRNYRPSGPNFIKYLIRIVIALVVLVLLIFAGRQIHHYFFVDEKPQSTPATTTTATGPSGSSPTSTSRPSSPSSTSSRPAGSASASASLPNNGPGDVLAIFLGTVAISTTLHYLVSARRQSANR